MSRSIIYVWSTGFWIYGADYHHGTHSGLGDYQEIVIGEGWHRSEVTKMVNDFMAENLLMWQD